MDCVTCMLMGMCMLCGPGFGGSKSNMKTSGPPEAGAPGRPLTRAEMDLAVENLVQRFGGRPSSDGTGGPPSKSMSYERRQSFVDDPRFSSMGIGKRGNVRSKNPWRPTQGYKIPFSFINGFDENGKDSRDLNSLEGRDAVNLGRSMSKSEASRLGPGTDSDVWGWAPSKVRRNGVSGLLTFKLHNGIMKGGFLQSGLWHQSRTEDGFPNFEDSEVMQRDSTRSHSEGEVGRSIPAIMSTEDFQESNPTTLLMGDHPQLDSDDDLKGVNGAIGDEMRSSSSKRNESKLGKSRTFKYFLDHFQEKQKLMAKAENFLQNQRQELAERRMKNKMKNPLFSAMGIVR